MRINKSSFVVFEVFIFFAIYFSHTFSQGFLKTKGTPIINVKNEEIKLKGIGLREWLLQEEYMLKTPYSIMGAEHEIKREIDRLVGNSKTEELYKIYHQNYVREIDVKNIATWGFNSIRLPMHYNKLITEILPLTFNEEGFKQINSLLAWCEKNNLYLILNLHTAPGRQSDKPICNYDKTNANTTPLSEQRFQFLSKLVNKSRQLDSTRLITAALEKHYIDDHTQMINDPFGEVVDIIGCNFYIGLYDGLPEKWRGMKWKTIYNKPVIIS